MFYDDPVAGGLAWLEATGESWAGYAAAVHDAAVNRRDEDGPAEDPAP